MIPKNTSSSNFIDTFSSLFSALGLCSLLKVAGFRKRAGYGASVSELLFSVLSSCFLVLKGKYSKTLFRLLTQYKNMGKAYKQPVNSITFDRKNFKELMGIPKSSIYTTARIEKQILEPAIGEIFWTQIDILTNYNCVEFR